MKNGLKKLLIVILIILTLISGIVIGTNWNSWFGNEVPVTDIDENAEEYTGDEETYTGKKNTDTIDIPGFDSMNFQAGVTEQKVNLYNPEQNTCYFKMSIFMNDGTKLWESELVEPGKGMHKITLINALDVGSYENCILKYECFSMNKEQTPLNGSEIKFTLNVLE